MRPFILANLCVLVISLLIGSSGHPNEAGWFSLLATIGVMLVAVLYIIVRDPLNKWPKATSLQRLVNLFSFRR